MKKHFTTSLLTFAILFSTSLLAQDILTERKLIGNWKLIIDVEKELKEAEEETEGESFIAEVTMKWVSGVVSGVLDELDIYMEFRKDGEVKVTVEAFDEIEIEYTSWYIKDGKLYIEDTESFTTEGQDYWMLEDGVLMGYEGDQRDTKRKENVYMVSID